MKQIADLTACRALFAGWVFAYHINLHAHYDPLAGPLGPVVRSGALGVDGFFILSGMILAYAHADLAPTLGQARAFWAKRLVRIYPLHLLMIATMAAMVGGGLLAGLHPREPDRFGLDELVRHLLLVHAWGFSDRWAWNYPSWSISAEWAGYLAFPLLLAGLRGAGPGARAALLGAALLAAWGAQALAVRDHLSLTYDGGLLRFLPEFCAGVLALGCARAANWPVAGRVVAWSGAALVLGGCWLGSNTVAIAGLWMYLAGLMRANLERRPGLLGRLPGMVWLGEISYAFYMSFALVETFQSSLWRAAGVSPTEAKLAYGVTATAMTLALATLAWALVERPSLRAFAAWRRRTPARAAVRP